MTAEELYDIKLQIEDISEKLGALARKHFYTPFTDAALVSEKLEQYILDCLGKLAIHEISERRNKGKTSKI